MRLTICTEHWPYRVPFKIARGVASALDTILVSLTDSSGFSGRGEAAGVDYEGETVHTMCSQLESVRPWIHDGLTANDLAQLLPPGGARNALDCALWDLIAKRANVSAWERAGFKNPRAVVTCVTIGIDTIESVRRRAIEYQDWPMLKVKVDGTNPLEVVRAVHEQCPKSSLVVDANQAWNLPLLNALAADMESLGVALIEQPIPREKDDCLADYNGHIRLAADESCSDRRSLAQLSPRYGVINIKLDKCGGLTEGLALARAGIERGFSLMIGCMGGSSLAMAPAMVIGQIAEFVDLDGPLLHSSDRTPCIEYRAGRMSIPNRSIWG
jgi:L-alanine-DL-glutamate epimerase-like enolase superfamily enzyme